MATLLRRHKREGHYQRHHRPWNQSRRQSRSNGNRSLRQMPRHAGHLLCSTAQECSRGCGAGSVASSPGWASQGGKSS